ncbi:hypothetical protein F7725_007582 [Dissostichus mawsoni]|uniref:Uncharacterized protein n=1 Tax=Dissostichus mawsoni TaxID=36200 RepID=A0A7J5Y6U3_DISMA|nr:hypothetical protein F7725_007582 [Dissostichus mawsoni]
MSRSLTLSVHFSSAGCCSELCSTLYTPPAFLKSAQTDREDSENYRRKMQHWNQSRSKNRLPTWYAEFTKCMRSNQNQNV